MRSTLLFTVIFGCLAGFAFAADHNDVSHCLEFIGDPAIAVYRNEYVARSVWDLQVHNGRVYVGHGDLQKNLGPVDIWSYDPVEGVFFKEYRVDEEAVLDFRIIHGQLVVPGTDPKGAPSAGNFYRLEPDGWKTYNTIPDGGAHNLDMIGFKEKMFARVSGFGAGYSVAESNDGGLSWKTHNISNGIDFFVLNGVLYLSGTLCHQYVDTGFIPLDKGCFRPSSEYSGSLNSFVNFKDKVVCRVCCGRMNSSVLAVASSKDEIKLITLPSEGTVVDIVVYNNACYVLTSTHVRGTYSLSDSNITTVVKSTDLENWDEILRFQYGYARSLEVLNEDIYIGFWAGDYGHIESLPWSNIAGDLVRIRKQYYEGIDPKGQVLLFPPDGAYYYEGEDIKLSVVGSGAGDVANVRFYRNHSLISNTESTPFVCNWQSPPAGKHTLVAAITMQTGQLFYDSSTITIRQWPMFTSADSTITLTPGQAFGNRARYVAPHADKGGISWIRIPKGPKWLTVFYDSCYGVAPDTACLDTLMMYVRSTADSSGIIGPFRCDTLTLCFRVEASGIIADYPETGKGPKLVLRHSVGRTAQMSVTLALPGTYHVQTYNPIGKLVWNHVHHDAKPGCYQITSKNDSRLLPKNGMGVVVLKQHDQRIVQKYLNIQ